MNTTASITVNELCNLVGDAAFVIDALLVKYTGHDIHGNTENYAHYENIMPKLNDLFGQLNHLCNELDTQAVMGNSVTIPIK